MPDTISHTVVFALSHQFTRVVPITASIRHGLTECNCAGFLVDHRAPSAMAVTE
jgi:hypothetical protein